MGNNIFISGHCDKCGRERRYCVCIQKIVVNPKPKKEYIPFGEEWKKEMMKMSKSDLIDFLRKSLAENRRKKSMDLLSEKEFNDWVNKTEPPAIVKVRSSQFKKGMFTGYLVTLQMIDENND